jgi:hypothetical protein
MSFKKWVTTALLAAICFSTCLASKPATATIGSRYQLTCAQAQAAVAFLQQLQEEVAEWYQNGWITATQEQWYLGALQSQIDKIEAAAAALPGGCTF